MAIPNHELTVLLSLRGVLKPCSPVPEAQHAVTELLEGHGVLVVWTMPGREAPSTLRKRRMNPTREREASDAPHGESRVVFSSRSDLTLPLAKLCHDLCA